MIQNIRATRLFSAPPVSRDLAPAKDPRAEVSLQQPKNVLAELPGTNSRADAGRTAILPEIVKANQNVIAQPGTESKYGPPEHIGTTGSPSFKPKTQDRFGIDKPEQDPLQTLRDRTGQSFDPAHDLRINPGDAASKSPSIQDQLNALKDKSDAQQKQIDAQQKQIDSQQKQIDGLSGIVSTLLGKQAVNDFMNALRAQEAAERKANEALSKIPKPRTKAENPNPQAPDNSSGGPNDPLINNLRSARRIRPPYVDPVVEEPIGASGALKGRDQAVDPVPDADKNDGGGRRQIRTTSDAVTDPSPVLALNYSRLANLRP